MNNGELYGSTVEKIRAMEFQKRELSHVICFFSTDYQSRWLTILITLTDYSVLRFTGLAIHRFQWFYSSIIFTHHAEIKIQRLSVQRLRTYHPMKEKAMTRPVQSRIIETRRITTTILTILIVTTEKFFACLTNVLHYIRSIINSLNVVWRDVVVFVDCP